MSKDNENISFFDDLPQPTEPAGFSHQQMVRCDECLRANPPTRVDCLYCGLALPFSEASLVLAKPSLRPLEPWEQGYNNVLLRVRDGEPSEKLCNQVANFLRQEPSAIQRVLSAKRALPLVRTATVEEALLVERRLNDLGLETVMVQDQDLQVEASPPRRLRRLELRETDFLGYQTSNADGIPIDWAEINLVIVGRLFVTQMELRERKSRKAENEILDASESTSDEAVVDIYAGKREESWRISASGFDFSCLGKSKALLAGENFPKLINLIRDYTPNAELNDSYAAVRHCLEMVWPPERRTASGGTRVGRSKNSTSEIITTNSEPQFTRYSRLCHYLKRNSLVQP